MGISRLQQEAATLPKTTLRDKVQSRLVTPHEISYADTPPTDSTFHSYIPLMVLLPFTLCLGRTMDPTYQSSLASGMHDASWDEVRASKRPAPRVAAAYPRKRAVTACQVCRARRTKCDNLKPKCSFCVKTGAECLSSPADFSSFDPASLKILERLDELESLLRTEGLQSISRPPASPVPKTQEPLVNRQILEPVEVILKWPVFKGRFSERTGLTALLSCATPMASACSPVTATQYPPVDDFDQRTCTRLLENFLQNVHVKNPLFEEVYARQLMRRICLDGIGHDVQSCLALLICALGSISDSFESPRDDLQDRASFAQGQAYFHAAQKRMGVLLGHCGVYETQCFFWSGVYLTCVMQPLSAWRMFVQALTCCQNFKFAARSVTESFELSELLSPRTTDLTMEERVYWSCWKSERELRAEIQPPDFKLNVLDYPHSFPTPPQNSVGMEHVSWCFYLAEISLLRLRIAAQSDLLSAGPVKELDYSDDLASTISIHESRIESWTRSLPVAITLENPQTEDDILKFILRGHRLNSYEMLYSLFVRGLIVDGQPSPNIITHATKGLQVHVDRLKINRPGFRHRHHGTWGMLRSCNRSALVLLAAAHHEYARQLMPEGWEDAVMAAIDLLEFWRYEVGDAEDRLSILRELWEELHV